MQTILKTENLTKRYGSKIAVNKVNITIEKGDIYGFIGKNGAGKTTTMRLLLGMSFADEGNIELFGSKDLNRARHRVGALIEAPGLYKNCTAYENMKRFSILYGGNDQDIREILSLVGLENTGKKKAGDFSLGMRQRLGIGLAMLGNPDLLILDEPINGLDPEGIKEIRDSIIRLNEEKGVSFMISSHLLDELGKIVTKYGIIRDGCLVEEISSEELHRRCTDGIRIRTTDIDKSAAFLTSILSQSSIQKHEDYILVSDDTVSAAVLNQKLVMAGHLVNEITMQIGSLENYFIERIG
ncbi:MAG: ATP-binding cassette domain-containing protein [Lachnospiraceae bacterium]|nr:ATP-binding cassette domain-containing protein [Lachnospiraceae bacterium]